MSDEITAAIARHLDTIGAVLESIDKRLEYLALMPRDHTAYARAHGPHGYFIFPIADVKRVRYDGEGFWLRLSDSAVEINIRSHEAGALIDLLASECGLHPLSHPYNASTDES